jgi:hypothetical protein
MPFGFGRLSSTEKRKLGGRRLRCPDTRRLRGADLNNMRKSRLDSGASSRRHPLLLVVVLLAHFPASFHGDFRMAFFTFIRNVSPDLIGLWLVGPRFRGAGLLLVCHDYGPSIISAITIHPWLRTMAH